MNNPIPALHGPLEAPAAPGQVLTPAAPPGALQEAQRALETLRGVADDHAAHRISERTTGLYAADWAHFTAWCSLGGLDPLPATVDAVRLYLADLSLQVDPDGAHSYKPSTMERRLASISHYHRAAGHTTPTRDPKVVAVLTGIRRARGTARRQMRPLLLEDVKAILATLPLGTYPTGVAAVRDAFVLLAGFAGAFRRSELAALTHGDLEWTAYDGLTIRLARSKTDQAGAGRIVPLPFGEHPGTCPVCAYVRWATVMVAADRGRTDAIRAVLATPAWEDWTHVCREGIPEIPPDVPLVRAVRRNGTLEGPVTGDALHQVIKRRAAIAGYRRTVGFHSLRAGFVTQARRNGADPRAIRRQTGHGSDAMVEVYDREWVPLEGNAVKQLGL